MTRPRVTYMQLVVASIVVLLAGLLSAVLIYQTADEESRSASVYERGEDASYPAAPQDSKKYLRDMELYGGKANVLATEFRLWFASLWQGKPLAYMVACITIFLSFAVFYAAGRLPRSSKPGRDRDDRTL